MVIFLLLGLVLTAVAVVLGVRTLAFGQLRRRETLAQIDVYGFSGSEAADRPRPTLREVANRAATTVGAIALRWQADRRQANLLALLRRAGYYRTQPETFLGYRIGAATLLPLFWTLLLANGGALGLKALLVLCMVGGLAWILPTFFLERRATSRLQQVDREMPELVDAAARGAPRRGPAGPGAPARVAGTEHGDDDRGRPPAHARAHRQRLGQGVRAGDPPGTDPRRLDR